MGVTSAVDSCLFYPRVKGRLDPRINESFPPKIEDEDIVKKILRHLGLQEVKPRTPSKATGSLKTVEHHGEDFV